MTGSIPSNEGGATADVSGDDWPPPRRDTPPEDPFGNVFGAEIPEGERAWRRGVVGEPAPIEAEPLPDPLLWAVESLPGALRELRAEMRRTADLATEALASAASVARSVPGGPPTFDPLPGALRELREEVREAGDRATEALAATRQGMDALPKIVAALRDELQTTNTRIAETLSAANQEAARAFSLVAREVRTLGDRQSVLREEIRLLGKRIEELERIRRRQPPRPAPRPE